MINSGVPWDFFEAMGLGGGICHSENILTNPSITMDDTVPLLKKIPEIAMPFFDLLPSLLIVEHV
jgi:hypothetical protein